MTGRDAEVYKEFGLDDYDEEDDAGSRLFGAGVHGAVRFRDGKDPFLQTDEDSEEDVEDFKIRRSDALLLAAISDMDMSHLEIYVYETEQDNLYPHHDIILPAFPLALAWMNRGPQPSHSNCVAIGTFQPEIEVWDLDVVDALEPIAILGGIVEAKKPVAEKKGKKKKKDQETPEGLAPGQSYVPGSHTDAVLSLAWSTLQPTVLASGSADCTVKLWDVTTQHCASTFSHFGNKVQTIEWHPTRPGMLVAGGFGGFLSLFDARTAGKSGVSRKFSSDIERISWHPHRADVLLVATHDGMVTALDSRTLSGKALWSLHAHDGAVSSLSLSPVIPDFLATASVDRSVKVWDIANDKPSSLATRAFAETGPLFSLGFCPDTPFALAFGGEKGGVRVWNTAQNAAVRARFENRVPAGILVTSGCCCDSISVLRSATQRTAAARHQH
eukprot:TRINITY_DN6027_c0_g1_i1.p1 TRINITY_DN6027_c0_g1~~TRINITY_DN6027_c0_g1_i1.p1  ORF type:complete len:512 (+),score=135.32 TRINITY_DN6027_c0_g1_i1:213-1538(+)